MTGRILRGPAAIEEATRLWARLESELKPAPFARRQWCEAALRHLGSGADAWILMAELPVPALLPLALRRAHGTRQLVFLAHGPSDYVAPLAQRDDLEVARALAEPLRDVAGEVDLLWLRGVAHPVTLDLAFGEVLGGRSISRVYERCPRIDCRGSWEAYLAGRRKKFRADLKRCARRVEGFGAVEVGRDPASSHLFEELIQVEQESWKWSSGLSMLRDSASRAFIREVVASDALGCEIWTLRVEGELAAFAIAFVANRTRYYYLPSFRARFPESGKFLLSEMVRDTFEGELDTFDLLQGDERYKLVWATEIAEVHELAVGRGLRGRAALAGLALRWRAARSPRLQTAHRWLQTRKAVGSAPRDDG